MKIKSSKTFLVNDTLIKCHKKNLQDVPVSVLASDFFYSFFKAGHVSIVEIGKSELESLSEKEENFIEENYSKEEQAEILKSLKVEKEEPSNVEKEETSNVEKEETSNDEKEETSNDSVDDDFDDVDLSEIKAKDAIEMIKNVKDIEKLYSMLEHEERATVIKAIEAQVELLEQEQE